MTEMPSSVPGTSGACRRFNRAGLAVVIFALSVIGVHLVRASLAVDPRGCVDTPGVLPDYWIMLSAVVALIAGSLTGAAAYDPDASTPDASTPGAKPGDRLATLVGSGAFALFLAVVAFSLVFEAVGVQQSQGSLGKDLRPITSYVRCAIHFDKTMGSGGAWTFLLFGMSAFLVGHWLWVHPSVGDAKARSAERSAPARTGNGWKRDALTVAVPVTAGLLLGAILSSLGPPFGVAGIEAQGTLAQGAGESGSYAWGIPVVIGVVFAIFISIAGLDLYFELRRWEPVGLRVQQWSLENRWYAGALLVVLGALVAHFLGNPIR